MMEYFRECLACGMETVNKGKSGIARFNALAIHYRSRQHSCVEPDDVTLGIV